MAKNVILTSPRGTAKYPKLNAPDTKFNAEGVYSVDLVLDPEIGAEFASKIDKMHEANMKAALEEVRNKNPKATKVKEGSLPYRIDDETGEYIIKYKMKAQFQYKGKTITQRPTLFDAKKTKLAEDTKIGGGSVIRVAAEVNPYYTPALGAGISLRLKGVQVLELRTYGESSADSLGFDSEDGFEAEDGESEGASDFNDEAAEGGEQDNNGDF